MDVYNKLGLDVSRDALNAYISAQGDTRTTYNQLINQAKSIISEVQNIIDKILLLILMILHLQIILLIYIILQK